MMPDLHVRLWNHDPDAVHHFCIPPCYSIPGRGSMVHDHRI